MTKMLAVTVKAYLGILPVAKVTLARFYDAYDADRFYNLMRECETDKIDHLKRCLSDFFETHLVFCIQKEEQDGPL